jgi:hypothetical protein
MLTCAKEYMFIHLHARWKFGVDFALDAFDEKNEDTPFAVWKNATHIVYKNVVASALSPS